MRSWLVIIAIASAPFSDAQGCTSCLRGTVNTAHQLDVKYAQPDWSEDKRAPRAKTELRGRTTYHLARGDVVEEDDVGHVVAVRHATTPTTWTRFKPGAVSPPDQDVVVGEVDVP